MSIFQKKRQQQLFHRQSRYYDSQVVFSVSIIVFKNHAHHPKCQYLYGYQGISCNNIFKITYFTGIDYVL